MIDLFGVSIHDPDVVFTDLGLALLGAYFGWRLWGQAGALARTGAVLMGGLSQHCVLECSLPRLLPCRHGHYRASARWIPVSLSIVVAAATMLGLALLLLVPGLPPRGCEGLWGRTRRSSREW